MTDRVLILTRLPEAMLSRLAADFPQLEFIDTRETATLEKHLADAAITYGLPAVDKRQPTAIRCALRPDSKRQPDNRRQIEDNNVGNPSPRPFEDAPLHSESPSVLCLTIRNPRLIRTARSQNRRPSRLRVDKLSSSR